MADEFRFVALRAFAGPPRLLVVVPYVEALWVRWAAAGLGALSQVWCGCAGAVIPAPVADHPALAGLLRRMQPDHVLAYTPSGATVETIRPGVIDRALGDLEGDAKRQSEALVRAEPWHHHETLEVEGAATGLRERLGVNAAAQETLSLPRISSVQVRPHAGTRGGCRRGGRVVVCRGGR